MNYYSKLFWIVKRLLLFSSRQPQARKRLCTPAGASSDKPDSNSLNCIVFFLTNVSATCFSSNLQILFSLPVMHNCIYILPFLGFKDTPFANFASTSHVFDNVKMLPSKITHPQLALSMLCGYFTSKFCIFNPRKSTIADIVAQYPLLLFTSQLEPIHYLQKKWYKKFERIWNGRWWHLERKFLR